MVQWHVRNCCIAHVLQPGVVIAFKIIGHKPDECQIVASLVCSLEGFIGAIEIVSVDLKVFRRLIYSLRFYLRLGQMLYLLRGSLCLVTKLWLTIAY